MRVTFIHPDLGIGGAERLVLDAVIALKHKGHEVKMVTNHYDPKHAFSETRDLIQDDITVIKCFPRSIFGSMCALCAYIRMCFAAIYVCIFMNSDVIVSDQVSAHLPILRLFTSARIIFYCHYPDLLLTERKTRAKSFYRYFLDWIEEWSTAWAQVICVNSLFTASVVRETFRSLRNKDLTVLYPTLNTGLFDNMEKCELSDVVEPEGLRAEHVFTSLNRYEAKKNVELALDAFAELKLLLSSEEYDKCYLIIAGGYDHRNNENVAYFDHLKRYAQKLGLSPKQYEFLKSTSDSVKINLLRMTRAVLYTPKYEHFGIVPVEAMYLGVPVIAVNSGGPKETICHEKTGFLVEQTAEDFATSMSQLVRDKELCSVMKIKGPERVRKMFAFETFATKLDKIVKGELAE